MGYALNKQILQPLQAEFSALPSLLGLLRDLISSEQYVNWNIRPKIAITYKGQDSFLGDG